MRRASRSAIPPVRDPPFRHTWMDIRYPYRYRYCIPVYTMSPRVCRVMSCHNEISDGRNSLGQNKTYMHTLRSS